MEVYGSIGKDATNGYGCRVATEDRVVGLQRRIGL
jgi:hypothetical protein